jgi:hypothetical protein
LFLFLCFCLLFCAERAPLLPAPSSAGALMEGLRLRHAHADEPEV